MSIELQILTWSVILGFVHIVLASSAANRQRSLSWNMGPRDAPIPPLTGVAGRLDRAQRNFFETFPLFVALILLVQIAGKNNETSQLAAILYLAARVIYIPLYALGIPVLRTITWGISIAGMVMLLKVILLG